MNAALIHQLYMCVSPAILEMWSFLAVQKEVLFNEIQICVFEYDVHFCVGYDYFSISYNYYN